MQGQALIANPQFSHDDLLFIRLAQNLAQGQWLGPYDNLTLSKGPFYPLWIAVRIQVGCAAAFVAAFAVCGGLPGFGAGGAAVLQTARPHLGSI